MTTINNQQWQTTEYSSVLLFVSTTNLSVHMQLFCLMVPSPMVKQSPLLLLNQMEMLFDHRRWWDGDQRNKTILNLDIDTTIDSNSYIWYIFTIKTNDNTTTRQQLQLIFVTWFTYADVPHFGKPLHFFLSKTMKKVWEIVNKENESKQYTVCVFVCLCEFINKKQKTEGSYYDLIESTMTASRPFSTSTSTFTSNYT